MAPSPPGGGAPGVKDADMWTLNVYGQLLPVDQPGGNSGSSAAVEATELMLSSLLSRLEVRFEGDDSPVAGRSVAWDGTAYGGEPRKCFTTHNPGKPQGTATVLLWPNWQPAKYKVPEALARVIGTDLETKPGRCQARELHPDVGPSVHERPHKVPLRRPTRGSVQRAFGGLRIYRCPHEEAPAGA